MHYIVFDLEFNQDFSSFQEQNTIIKRSKYPFEIIQIGAIKLDLDFNTIAIFNRYVKPTIYSKVNSFITELTGITTEQLLIQEPFFEVYNAYIEFIGNTESIFCIWGMSDIKELFRSVDYYKLDPNPLPKMFINLQPYASKHLNISEKKLLGLQNAIEMLNIPITYNFHNALYDAYYTAEIFKKIYTSSIQPKLYDPSYIKIRPIQRKKQIDYDSLIQQFRKMYGRDMTEEEQEIIKLAYKMGKTHQFLK
ncbi:3'-5' exonuclease [Tissierella sp. MB52-C2]|uniref:3'-5' exonuclease n=1 Tax=Tissierella sp. MB52-C2 TaxID=3070999 RepID=UPI00280BCE65|nr:3'-5' exonuclease [Tissierella sp. MB52-C2]WMM24899.1 3'-5' exonuclease [Tissierella sp. MB52-C2]